jgi:hypothetical protein
MLRLMRNIHLGLGLMFVLVALVFAASSLVIIYRPWLGTAVKPTEVTIPLSAAAAASPRAAALELMTVHGFRGELRQIQQRTGTFSFLIVRPGESNAVTYTPESGAATIATTRQGALETLVQLHTTHGFWHDYLPSNLWAALAFLGSLGLILLGVTGIYLWFLRYRSWVGGVLLGFGVIFACITLVLTRLQQ